ncbi:rfc2 (nucleomorph) [Hemiselmis andersenii]|uniref:Rfc2 n=1 Tax=Hemiselmis andersenii TaxID=464988 RepID=A9BKX0_HEMAN|nr:rfc2 [Hemiselmis andersenii]ABW98125.1 rfc2 [Hemiselmis andersenii]|mmetsp:Transcript_33764/g.79094  ORF Transcript_33764/g.79094 Transcript_33764/m.79094 type:complete len:320 (+) Transcript_33764:72-1031(+)
MIRKNDEPWTFKYRPYLLKELSIHKSLKKKFILMTKKVILPNIILSGPPGSGKTSGIFCLARKIFGKDFQKHVLCLNTSDNRGVEIIREKIKTFCQKKLKNENLKKKLVILDEADFMTITAQEALRRIMEIFSDKVRFALICNFPSKIIGPLQSRCAILRFKKIKETFLLNRLIFILNNEGVFFDIAGLEATIFLTNGDIRQILNMSQIIVKTFGNLTQKAIKKFCSLSNSTVFLEFFSAFSNKNVYFSQELLLDCINNGSNIIETIQRIFLFCKKIHINEKGKIKIFDILCHFRLICSQNVNPSVFLMFLNQKLCSIL